MQIFLIYAGILLLYCGTFYLQSQNHIHQISVFIPSILKSLNLKAHILYIFNYILKQQLIVWTLAAVA